MHRGIKRHGQTVSKPSALKADCCSCRTTTLYKLHTACDLLKAPTKTLHTQPTCCSGVMKTLNPANLEPHILPKARANTYSPG
jgi:hypothetical protein